MQNYLDVLRSVELFKNIADGEINTLLSCLSARRGHYGKNQVVFQSGEETGSFGVVLSGQVQIYHEDFYGNRNIIATAGSGDLFAESFVCAEMTALPVSVEAAAESELLFIEFARLAFPCERACFFHGRLIQNMLNIIARKNIALTRKLEFVSKRTTREKLLSYLSEEAEKAGSSRFAIPFNRQELADYLFVDRSAMSAELSKLQKEGLLRYEKNRFELL